MRKTLKKRDLTLDRVCRVFFDIVREDLLLGEEALKTHYNNVKKNVRQTSGKREQNLRETIQKTLPKNVWKTLSGFFFNSLLRVLAFKGLPIAYSPWLHALDW